MTGCEPCFGGMVCLVVWVGMHFCGVVDKVIKTTPKGVGALLRWVGLLFCVGWYPLLWRWRLKLFRTTPKGVGALLRCVDMHVKHLTMGCRWWSLHKKQPYVALHKGTPLVESRSGVPDMVCFSSF